MKFARYLKDTQTPEWKKAYIDYRGLKVQLGVIRAQALQQTDTSSSIGATDLDHPHITSPRNEERPEETHPNQASTTSARIGSPWIPGNDHVPMDVSGHESALPIRRRTSNQEKPALSLATTSLPPRITGTVSDAPSQQTSLPPRTPRPPPAFPFFRDSAGSPTPPPLHTILFNLPATHTQFFDMLDAELEKVETFYAEREKEMHERAKRLREQLDELAIHRQMFHRSSAHAKAQTWSKKVQRSVPSALSMASQWFQSTDAKPGETSRIGGTSLWASESGRNGQHGVVDTSILGTTGLAEHLRRSDDHSGSWKREGTEKKERDKSLDSPSKNNTSSTKALDDSTRSPPRRSNSLSVGGMKHPLDPHEYQHAKRRLRRAVIEHYRGLEVLNNYRILNLTGFRKALKKYEKITKNSVLDAYMKEKVEPSAFASGATVSTMLKEMEDLFAMWFERGDRKKAIDRLRVGLFSKTHHFSTFRSGLWLGLAVPAIGGGVYLSFREHVRGSLPSWGILLFVYSVLLIPVLLALLIGINIAVWAREKINYVFIFDLNPRSRLDHHEYFELPSFLLCTLAFAFWFSMAQIGPSMLWPLIWIALTFLVVFNPIRSFMWGHARWWIIKNTAKLGASGVWKVEFSDFWLGDQFCSLNYSFANLFFVGCYYTRFFANSLASEPESSSYPSPSISSMSYRAGGYTTKSGLTSAAFGPQAQDAWSVCGATQNWGWYYVLGILPFLVRFVQSLRRYWDSKLPTHLINAGKYGMGMVYYFFYYNWRHQGDPHAGASYILWCLAASAYAIYGCAWASSSASAPHAQYPLLRQELIFKTQIPSYYFALISNLCIRFLWLAYVPAGGMNITLRGFIVAMLEMLRRVQWNFYRLENEHLGNVDQYRVTREVPLPYSFEMHSNEEEEQEQENENEDVEEEMCRAAGGLRLGSGAITWWKKLTTRAGQNGGHG